MSGEIGQALKLSAIRKGKDPQFSSQSPSFFHHVVVLISVIGPHTVTWSLLSSPDTQMQTNRPTLSYAAIIEMEKDYKLHKSKDQLKNERQNSYLINIPVLPVIFLTADIIFGRSRQDDCNSLCLSSAIGKDG